MAPSTENTAYLDSLILQALRQNDEKALEYLFATYYNSLYRAGLKWSLDRHLTEECIQLVFQDVWLYRHKLANIMSFEAYLKGSLRKRIAKLSKPKNIHAELENVILPTETYEELMIVQEENVEQRQRIEKALNQLSPRQKEIIVLKYFEELSYKEISDKTGLQIDSIYKALHEGIKKMRLILK